MRPLSFIIGLLLLIYFIVEAMKGRLQYSFEGFVGTGVYGIASHLTDSMPSEGLFMSIVYAFTVALSLLLMWIGITGGKK